MVWSIALAHTISTVVAVNIYHYYHVYCDPDENWREIVADHCETLRSSGLAQELGWVYVGIVGNIDQRMKRMGRIQR